MKIINVELVYKVTLACIIFLLIAAFPGSAAEIDNGLAQCAGIKDDNTARLQCFDDLAKKQNAAKEAVNLKPVEKKDAAVIVEKVAANGPAGERKAVSVMEKYWDMSLDPNKDRNIFVLWPYRPNYLLPVAYNSSPNEDAQLDIDPQAKTQYTEAKFQISFKIKVWEDLVGKGIFRSSSIWWRKCRS